MLEFITSLKPSAIAQKSWQDSTVEQRFQILQSVGLVIQRDEQQIALELAKDQNLSLEFVLKNEVRPAAKAFLGLKTEALLKGHFLPLGLISILLPRFFSFRLACEKLAEGLLAGNAFVIKTSPKNVVTGKLLRQVLKSTQIPAGLVNVFDGDRELGQLLVSHPAVKGVIAMGRASVVDKIRIEAITSWKKVQIYGGFHNSALVLPDADLDLAVSSLMESCFRGMGQLPWNIQNILVTENHQKEFQEKFVKKIVATKFSKGPSDSELFSKFPISAKPRIEELWQKAKAETGTVLSGGQIEAEGSELKVYPMVIRDLSHCSTLQQDWIGAPLILINPVKYAHEMVKWTNTSYYGMVAQVFGSDEKVQKFGSQLLVGSVLGPDWIEGLDKIPAGHRQSSYGNMGSMAFEDFFSQKVVM